MSLRCAASLVLAALGALTSTDSRALRAQQSVTAPERFFGRPIGADHFLANYTQLVGYWQELADQSDRLVLEEIGTTSYGQKHWVAVISSPANLARREEYRGIAERLCRARGLNDTAARELADRGKAIVWIDAGMHATESVAAQNIIELAYRMTSRSDAEVRRILDEVILLVCPANPDGMELIANAYMATRRVGSIPVLYQRYIGHDNNRDYYACNMPETRNISRMLYRRWYPQIVYNHHQTAPRGTVIFTPPFRDPFNYNVDPIVVRGISLVSANMNQRFARENKPGVISKSGAPYSTWWNGGLRTTAYFHNMIGILTETFGSPNPTRIEQSLTRRLPSGDYPMPIGSQLWHARQTIEYLQTANFAILDLAARQREHLLFDIYRMGRNAIDRGERDHWTVTPRLVEIARQRQREAREEIAAQGGESSQSEGPPTDLGADLAGAVFVDPRMRDARAYVVPADQPDFTAATRFVNALFHSGVEVHRTRSAVDVDGRVYPAGSYFVSTAQAFRPHVCDMFEAQWHPTDIDASGEPIRPYDSTGWTLAMQMDVDFDRFLDRPPASLIDALEPLTEPARVPARALGDAAPCYYFDARDLGSTRAVQRLLAAGEQVERSRAEVRIGKRALPAGALCVRAGAATRDRLASIAAEFGIEFVPGPAAPAQALRPLRIGLFDVYGGNMATGWTQWVLEQAEFPVQLVFGRRIHRGDLREDFDVLIFHTGIPSPRDGGRVQRALRRGRPANVTDEQLDDMLAKLPPFEDWSTVRDRRVRLKADLAIPNLRAFAEAGGTLIALGASATALGKHLELPVREGVWVEDPDKPGEKRRARRSEFFVPGSVLRLSVDPASSIAAGVSRDLATLFRRSPVFEVEADAADVRVHARYAEVDVLASGWAIGEESLHGKAAVLSASVGRGEVFLFGSDVVYRGQPTGTWKLLYNAILSADPSRGR